MGKKCTSQAAKKGGTCSDLDKPDINPHTPTPHPSGFVKTPFTCALGELDVLALCWYAHSRILATRA